jgi:hypothetical protein
MNRLINLGAWLGVILVLTGCDSPFGTADSTRGPALTVTPGVGRATVSWRAVPGAQAYRFEWSTDAAFASSTVVDGATSPQAIEGLLPGVATVFRVRAVLSNGPTVWSTQTYTPAGWTWSRPDKALGSSTRTEAKSFDLGDGGWVVFTTEYTDEYTGRELLRYDATGLTSTVWASIKTTTSGSDPVYSESKRLIRRGDWSTRWQEYQLNQSRADDGSWTSLSPIVTKSPDFTTNRTAFTLDGDSWTLVP